jgi:hypothetical protein
LGGSTGQPLFCEPLSLYGGGTTTRPAKGATAKNTNGGPIPPLYRNPAFFRPNGMPDTYSCGAQSTDGFGGPGLAQLGQPVTGRWSAITTGTQKGGFNFTAAPTTPPSTGFVNGIRATGLIGEFGNTYPYLYSYTYGTIRNDVGDFGPGKGPGSFNLRNGPGGSPFASINVKQGAAKFGGTMRMLGAMTTKVCYWLAAGGGGCSLGVHNWRYEEIGAWAPTMGGVVTDGAMYTHQERYYNTRMGSYSAITADGSRFPWTTGSVTVTAIRRGPHKTVHYAHGYDNRNTMTSPGLGTIQLVSPVLTTWLGFATYETGGIAVLRIKFLPEPQTWAMLVAGASLLAVGTRMRRH